MRRDYNHRSKADLISLKADLATTLPIQRAAGLTYTFASGIIVAPLTLRAVIALLRLRFGQGQVATKLTRILSKNSAQTDTLWNDTLEWMTNGKDAYDKLSAGGFNKSELSGFVDFMTSIGWVAPNRPEPFIAAETEAPYPGASPTP